MVDSCMQF